MLTSYKLLLFTWGIGDWGLGPIPNPQSPIPNPQSPYILDTNIILYIFIFIPKNIIFISNGK